MMRRTRKVLGLIGTIATASVLLAGCSASSGGDSSSSGTVTVWVRDYEKAIVQPLADAFNKSHKTQVKVTLIPAADFVQKLGTAASSGSAPDVAATDLVFTPYFASVGALADITDKVDALPYKDDLSPAHVRQSKYKGKTYAVPFTGDVSVMFYNKDLFKQAGLDPEKPPTTYAELQADAKAVSALGGKNKGFVFSAACGGCNIFELTPHIWASGGDVLNEDGTKATLDSSEVTDALQLYRDMWTDGSMPTLVQTDNGPNAGTAFQGGTIGMKPDGTSFLGSLVAAKKIDFGVFPIPGKDGGSASFAGGDNMSIMTGAKNPDGAWEFVKWATDEQAQKILASKSVLPIRMDLLDKIYTPLDPRYKVFADALKVGHTPYSTIENALFNDNNGVWSKMIQSAVFKGDIQGAQATAQSAAQALLDKANK
ncbi:ABC transporter substrate-binding protein [Leifsonia poae]|uniref:ABC transporter substrate-binding protein n=1 Tax=Leifsonia poae TaxID=110933 RepID=UPI003D664B45